MSYRQQTRRGQRSRPGLTLVELLVVITILILLVALLLPAIMRLRALTEQQEDREQLRVLGHAWLSYAQAHGGHPVTQRTSDPQDRWLLKLSGYGELNDYLVSPADPNKKARLQYMQDNPGRLCTSFVLNPYFDPNPTKDPAYCNRLSDCISLSRALAILPVSAQAKSGVPGPGYIFPKNWFISPLSLAYARATSLHGIQPDRFGFSTGEQVPGFANYFFADGHVETITADQISRWLSAGKNFLIPEQ